MTIPTSFVTKNVQKWASNKAAKDISRRKEFTTQMGQLPGKLWRSANSNTGRRLGLGAIGLGMASALAVDASQMMAVNPAAMQNAVVNSVKAVNQEVVSPKGIIAFGPFSSQSNLAGPRNAADFTLQQLDRFPTVDYQARDMHLLGDAAGVFGAGTAGAYALFRRGKEGLKKQFAKLSTGEQLDTIQGIVGLTKKTDAAKAAMGEYIATLRTQLTDFMAGPDDMGQLSRLEKIQRFISAPREFFEQFNPVPAFRESYMTPSTREDRAGFLYDSARWAGGQTGKALKRVNQDIQKLKNAGTSVSNQLISLNNWLKSPFNNP